MCPLDCPQILAWFLSAAPCILFFSVNFATADSLDRKFWTPLFAIPYSLGILLFAIATLTTHPLPELASPDYGHYCRYCRQVVPNEAKHCRRCNKCRLGFDHHCRYINNCVTKSNYFQFFFGCLFLVSAAVIGLSHLILVAVSFSSQKSDILGRMESFYQVRVTDVGFWVLFGCATLFDLALIAPMLVLIVYHVFFQSAGITTYDYIMDDVSNVPQKLQRLTCAGDRVKHA